MKKLKQFFDLVPLLLLWLMLSVFLWGFVFTRLTDAAPENKVVLFADAPLANEATLAAALEETLSPPVEMVQVRSFDYAMMDSSEIEQSDLYIVGASEVETYRAWFAPLPPELTVHAEVLSLEGVPLGVKIWDVASQTGAAGDVIGYAAPGKVQEDHYLFFGAGSLHVAGHENAVDNQAVDCALRLLEMQ